jgi:hypothetical protein
MSKVYFHFPFMQIAVVSSSQGNETSSSPLDTRATAYASNHILLQRRTILAYSLCINYSSPPSFGPSCAFLSPTSNATKNLLTQLYAAIVAVISTISLSLKKPFSRVNTASGTLTSSVMASVYASTAACASDKSPSLASCGADLSTAVMCAGVTSVGCVSDSAKVGLWRKLEGRERVYLLRQGGLGSETPIHTMPCLARRRGIWLFRGLRWKGWFWCG